MHINLHTNKENRCVYKYIYIKNTLSNTDMYTDRGIPAHFPIPTRSPRISTETFRPLFFKKTVSKETDQGFGRGNKNAHNSSLEISAPFRIRGIRRNGEACCFERKRESEKRGSVGISLIRNHV